MNQTFDQKKKKTMASCSDQERAMRDRTSPNTNAEYGPACGHVSLPGPVDGDIQAQDDAGRPPAMICTQEGM